MGEENVEQIRVAGTLHVYAAPEDTDLPLLADLPADAEAYASDNGLDPAYVRLGFTSPDGSQFSDSKTVNKIKVHQRFRGVRTVVTEVATTAKFVLRQYDPDSVKLGFGGGDFTYSGGNTQYDPPDPSVVDRRVIVLDAIDGDIIDRYVIKRGMVSGDVTAAFARTEASDIPLTIEADEASDGQAWLWQTNDPAFLAGS